MEVARKHSVMLSKTSNYRYLNAELEGVGIGGALKVTDDTADKRVAAAGGFVILGWHHSYPHVAIAAAA
jgi:hypothetical protein